MAWRGMAGWIRFEGGAAAYEVDLLDLMSRRAEMNVGMRLPTLVYPGYFVSGLWSNWSKNRGRSMHFTNVTVTSLLVDLDSMPMTWNALR